MKIRIGLKHEHQIKTLYIFETYSNLGESDVFGKNSFLSKTKARLMPWKP